MADEQAITRTGEALGAAHATPPRPEIEGYILHEALASGGFGVVYRAERQGSGEPVALKLLHPELVTRPEVVLRFEREVEAIRRIQHPNVIKVLEVGRASDGRPYFAMELLSGKSLHDHLGDRGRISIEEALAILEPLCAAIDAAHAQGIIHRDIKASNVFLSDEGGSPRVVLLDFGLAKLLDALGPALTASRHILGTVACMAPEQILSRAIDKRTDVYALGVLAYRMLSGDLPFLARSLPAIQQMHLYAIPHPPSARAPLSAAFDEAVLRALRKNPDERPPSAAAFLAELSAAAVEPHGGRSEERPALCVYIEVRADPEAMDEPEERLLEDLESILPFASSALERAGFQVVTETGTSLLVTLERPDDAKEDDALRGRALQDVAKVHDRLLSRKTRHEHVHVQIWAHTGLIRVAGGGKVVGGALLEIASWLPDGSTSGLFASPEALAGLDLTMPAMSEVTMRPIVQGSPAEAIDPPAR